MLPDRRLYSKAGGFGCARISAFSSAGSAALLYSISGYVAIGAAFLLLLIDHGQRSGLDSNENTALVATTGQPYHQQLGREVGHRGRINRAVLHSHLMSTPLDLNPLCERQDQNPD